MGRRLRFRKLWCRMFGHEFIGRSARFGRPELRLWIVRRRCVRCWQRGKPYVKKQPREFVPWTSKTFFWPTL